MSDYSKMSDFEINKAVAIMAGHHCYYEADDGPLTDAQLQRIDEVNTCNDIAEEEVVNRIF